MLYNDNYIYDENGNPLNIDYQEFEWTNGRQLKSITYHYANDTRRKVLEYTYDDNGLRTSKTFSIYKYDYIYDGDKLLAELKRDPDDGSVIDRREFFYDGNDEPIGFTRNNGQNTYFYLKDAEGDILGFTDGSGSMKGGYYYDAWGKSGHIGSLSWENPLTYRGYYYDDENMVYYLQSRYYNPQWGRFLNADLPEIAQQSKDEINGINLFAYCTNDPVNNSDPTGKRTKQQIIKSIKNIAKNLKKYSNLKINAKYYCFYIKDSNINKVCNNLEKIITDIDDLQQDVGVLELLLSLVSSSLFCFILIFVTINTSFNSARKYIRKLKDKIKSSNKGKGVTVKFYRSITKFGKYIVEAGDTRDK